MLNRIGGSGDLSVILKTYEVSLLETTPYYLGAEMLTLDWSTAEY